MKILVIGGSYFFGRWFVQFASNEHDITVINRGTIKVGLPGVNEIIADRRDENALKALSQMELDYDCIVDFCAYEPDDIRTMVDSIGLSGKRYVFVSTVDVYDKNSEQPIDEECSFAREIIEGAEGDYIRNKIALEEELVTSCEKAGMEYCSVRPSLLYGPANYAPRESLYFQWISQYGQIFHPVDADGFFQPLYIKDASLMLKKICETEHMESAYNLCTENCVDYETWANVLHEIVDVPFEEIPVSVVDVLEKNIPLPFPLTREESSRYSNDRIKNLGVEYTDLKVGLRKCYELR